MVMVLSDMPHSNPFGRQWSTTCCQDSSHRCRSTSNRIETNNMRSRAYAFQILDIVLHEERKQVKEGYLFVSVFRDGLWQLADLLVLSIIFRISYYQFLSWGARPAFHAFWILLSMVTFAVLVALALFRWAVSTATIILGLNGVSSLWTRSLVVEAARLSTGYQITYFLSSTMVVGLAAYYIGRRTYAFREKFDMASNAPGNSSEIRLR